VVGTVRSHRILLLVASQATPPITFKNQEYPRRRCNPSVVDIFATNRGGGVPGPS